MKNKKILFISAGFVAILILGAIVGSIFFQQQISDWKIQNIVKNNKEWQEQYVKVKEMQRRSEEKSNNDVGLLVSLGFEWKSLGDITKNSEFYKKALDTYKLGIEKFGNGNIAFYWNAGKVAELLNDYNQAEYFYKEAIRVAPTYNESYHYLADLYNYKLKKDSSEILQIYANGLDATGGDATLFLSQCSFLRYSDRKDKALECYEILSKNYPDNELYKEVIQELKQQIKNS